MVCQRTGCGTEFFPRVDPAVIVLVTDGDRALLGRQPGWPAGRYSTIAGFVEPGESLEDAVRREVLEETGIETGAASYQSSQPWPFPRSLMLGFRAEALSSEIRLGDRELEDARWFHRDELRGGSMMPFPQSIAYRLIQEWLNP
jgi:NAD+ diphosphatase